MNRYCIFALLMAWSWLTMTLVHELGHVVVGCLCGGTLAQVEIRPWRLPYSFFAPDRSPLLTLWGGPIIGIAVPLIVAWVTKKPTAWFVAWFCIVANGIYLLIGCYSGEAELDSTKMIKAGMPTALLVFVSGAITVLGYVGFRGECKRVFTVTPDSKFERNAFLVSCAVLTVVVVIQTVLGTAIL